MQSIGEQLEETRKRLGLSLREASEATKIRADYLQNMENGEFSFRLPEVYKRGFLKIYARYLKLDADKLSADYNAQALAISRMGSGNPERENLGRVEAGGEAAPGDAPPTFAGAPGDRLDTGAGEPGSATIVKLIAVVIVVIIAFVAVFVGVQHMLSSAATEEPKTPAITQNTTATAPQASALPKMDLTFSAEDDISNVMVRQGSDRKVLYNAPLTRGQSISVSSQGPVEILVTSAQYLDIEQNGKKTAPGDASGKRLSGPQDFYWPPKAAGTP